MNYYNEWDPKAAAWLRALIDQSLLPRGHVDERSITEIKPEELNGYSQCHFFAGIGGWLYALQLAGVPADQPLWTGSAPCQPFSSAGRRGGYDDERHLAPKWLDLIRECRPPIVIGEQVATAASSAKHPWLDDLQDALEAEGYATGASVLPACGIGAPHIRQRLFFGAVRLADTECPRSTAGLPEAQGRHEGRPEVAGDGGRRQLGSDERGSEPDRVADARSQRHDGIDPLLRASEGGRHETDLSEAAGSCECGRVADTSHRDRRGRSQPDSTKWTSGHDQSQRGSAVGGMADAECHQEHEEQHGSSEIEGKRPANSAGRRSVDSGMADAERWAAERHGHPLGAAPGGVQGEARERQRIRDDDGYGSAVDRVADNESQPSAEEYAPAHATQAGWDSPDWLFCRDGKWRPVESGTFPLAHGIPARVGRLRGYGNAIVPQVASEFIRAFLKSAPNP